MLFTYHKVQCGSRLKKPEAAQSVIPRLFSSFGSIQVRILKSTDGLLFLNTSVDYISSTVVWACLIHHSEHSVYCWVHFTSLAIPQTLSQAWVCADSLAVIGCIYSVTVPFNFSVRNPICHSYCIYFWLQYSIVIPCTHVQAWTNNIGFVCCILILSVVCLMSPQKLPDEKVRI